MAPAYFVETSTPELDPTHVGGVRQSLVEQRSVQLDLDDRGRAWRRAGRAPRGPERLRRSGLVEHVVGGGGTAEFVASGELADLGHIGLVLQ